MLIDSRANLESTSRNYILADSLIIKQAFANTISTSPLHQINKSYFKNAYALLTPLDGEPAILVLEANVNYFYIIRQFRQALLILAIISASMLTLLTIFLIIATVRFAGFKFQVQQVN